MADEKLATRIIMKNFDSPGRNVTIPTNSLVGPNNPPKSGDPVVAGRLVGVMNYDGVAGDNSVVSTKGVYNLSVASIHNGLSVGETVFIDPSTAVLSDDFTDVPYGTALDPVASLATTKIRVRLFGATPGATGANS